MKAKKNKRYSLSVMGLTGQRLRARCSHHGVSVSGYVEELIAAALDAEGWPEEKILRPRVWPDDHNKSGPKKGHTYKAGGIFTF